MNEATQTDTEGVTEKSLDWILAEFDKPFDGTLREEALRAAQQRREEITPHLLRYLDEAISKAEQAEDATGEGHFYALYLLTEFQEKKALPLLSRVFQFEFEDIDYLFGDVFYEIIARTMAVMATPDEIDQILSDAENLYGFLCWELSKTYLHFVNLGTLTREEALERLNGHLKHAVEIKSSNDIFVTGMISTINDLGPQESRGLIQQAYQQNMVDNMVINMNNIDQTIQRHGMSLEDMPPMTCQTVLEDTVQELSSYHFYQESVDFTPQKPAIADEEWQELGKLVDTFSGRAPKWGGMNLVLAAAAGNLKSVVENIDQEVNNHACPQSFPRWLLVFICLASICKTALSADDEQQKPTPLIFDTDIGNDVDDVLALGMIHALQSRGECELLAVTITKDHELAAPFTDAVNTFYGRGNIPIGVCSSGVTDHAGKFNPLVEKQSDGDYRYPHDLRSGQDAPAAVTVLRQALAAAEDHSVAIAQVGFSTNLANLLKSPPDEISPLTGQELVQQKVKLLSIMAGAFEKIQRGNEEPHDHLEYNIIKDIPSAQTIAREWPTEIVWSGYEIGLSVPYPHQSILRDYDYVQHHPLAEAYVVYNPPPHNRPTWDLTSVLYAVRPNYEYFTLSKPGTVTVRDDGLTTFNPNEDGRDHYLKLNDQQRIRLIEAMVQLASQPPQTTGQQD